MSEGLLYLPSSSHSNTCQGHECGTALLTIFILQWHLQGPWVWDCFTYYLHPTMTPARAKSVGLLYLPSSSYSDTCQGHECGTALLTIFIPQWHLSGPWVWDCFTYHLHPTVTPARAMSVGLLYLPSSSYSDTCKGHEWGTALLTIFILQWHLQGPWVWDCFTYHLHPTVTPARAMSEGLLYLPSSSYSDTCKGHEWGTALLTIFILQWHLQGPWVWDCFTYHLHPAVTPARVMSAGLLYLPSSSYSDTWQGHEWGTALLTIFILQWHLQGPWVWDCFTYHLHPTVTPARAMSVGLLYLPSSSYSDTCKGHECGTALLTIFILQWHLPGPWARDCFTYHLHPSVTPARAMSAGLFYLPSSSQSDTCQGHECRTALLTILILQWHLQGPWVWDCFTYHLHPTVTPVEYWIGSTNPV